MSVADVNQVAQMIVGNPKMVAAYFTNPKRALAQAVPGKGLMGRLLLKSEEDTRAERAKVAAAVEEKITNDRALLSLRDANKEKELFLKDAMRNPQRTFDTILWMSVVTFAVGIAFVAGAFVAAIFGDDTTQKSVIAGLSGGSGLITTLGVVFATSRQAIRRINGDNAQIRVILTDFATQISNLRAVAVGKLEEAKAVNEELRQVMADVVQRIEDFAEPPKDGSAKQRPP